VIEGRAALSSNAQSKPGDSMVNASDLQTTRNTKRGNRRGGKPADRCVDHPEVPFLSMSERENEEGETCEGEEETTLRFVSGGFDAYSSRTLAELDRRAMSLGMLEARFSVPEEKSDSARPRPHDRRRKCLRS